MGEKNKNNMGKKNIIKGRWYNINKKIKRRLIAKYHKIKDWKMDPKGYFLIGVDKKKNLSKLVIASLRGSEIRR